MHKLELKGIVIILLIVLVLGILLAGTSGKLEQWGLPWFTGVAVHDKIVFVSDRSGTREIYMMNLDGSSQKQLTKDANVLSAPTVSMAGNKIAFVGMVGSASEVLAVGFGGCEPYAVSSSTGPKRLPAYCPDGKKLSYIDSGKVYVSELNGSNAEPVLPNHDELVGAMGNPTGRTSIPRYSAYVWGPDGESMAGVSSPDRLTDSLVYVSKQDAELQRVMPPLGGTKVNGMAFATAKEMLVAALQMGQNGGEAVLITFDPQEKQSRPILALKGLQFGVPAVSPDGSIIVVQVSSLTGKTGAGLIKVALQSNHAGIFVKGNFEKPVFSPSGKVLIAAMHDEKSGKRSVVSIDPTSGRITRLATDGDCFDAVFTPASKK